MTESVFLMKFIQKGFRMTVIQLESDKKLKPLACDKIHQQIPPYFDSS